MRGVSPDDMVSTTQPKKKENQIKNEKHKENQIKNEKHKENQNKQFFIVSLLVMGDKN